MLLSEICGLGALSDERMGLQLAVQSLNCPTRAEPVTILYCLIWDSKSKSLYDWRSVRQYVLVSSALVGLATRYYFLSECFCLKFAVLFLWGALSDESKGLQFAV
jgi:hypothetical protein